MGPRQIDHYFFVNNFDLVISDHFLFSYFFNVQSILHTSSIFVKFENESSVAIELKIVIHAVSIQKEFYHTKCPSNFTHDDKFT